MQTLSTRDLVAKAWKLGIVIPAYNVPHLPMMEPIVRALRDTGSFGLIQVARLEIKKFKAESYRAIRDEYARQKDEKHTRLHLDHVPVIDEDNLTVDYDKEIRECLELGFESVMVDGSRLPFEENAAATRKVVEAAKEYGRPVEGELGAVIGHEAGPMPPYEELFASGKGFTDPAEAKEFVQRTGLDWLSVAIGNFHGAVAPGRKDDKKIAARLNIEHLKKIRDVAGVPLVLHGGSGIQKEYLREAFKSGIAKINVGTNIRQPYERGAAESVEKGQEEVYKAMVDVITNELGVEGTAAKLLG
jgi:ketose-bisphosphate aldolase